MNITHEQFTFKAPIFAFDVRSFACVIMRIYPVDDGPNTGASQRTMPDDGLPTDEVDFVSDTVCQNFSLERLNGRGTACVVATHRVTFVTDSNSVGTG